MKIFALLALLISLSAAYVSFDHTSVANSTQSLASPSDSTGTCTVTAKYDGTTLSGTFTCTGLKGNVSAAHLHDCGASYSVAVFSGNVLADVMFTINTDGASGSFTSDFKDTVTMDALCNDQCYWNFHTPYAPNGEVRANLVSMKPVCNIEDEVALDGVVHQGADAPDGSKIDIPSFYVGYQASATVGSGAGYIYLSWDAALQQLVVSGIMYDLKSDINTMYMYYTDDGGSSFLTVSTYTIPSGRPFSFIAYYLSDWNLARVTSSKANLIIETYDSTTDELKVDFASTTYPSFDSTCKPYTDLKYDATEVLTCYYGYEGSTIDYDCSAGSYCSVSTFGGEEYKTCTTMDYCYTCGCGATVDDLPSSGYACCDVSYCNSLSLATVGCIFGGAGSNAVGLLVSLFVVLFMKWFN